MPFSRSTSSGIYCQISSSGGAFFNRSAVARMTASGFRISWAMVAVSWPTLPTGRLVRIEYPDDGFDAWVTRFVRDSSGRLINQRTFYSHYSMVKGVQYVGDPNGANISVPSYAPGAQGG